MSKTMLLGGAFYWKTLHDPALIAAVEGWLTAPHLLDCAQREMLRTYFIKYAELFLPDGCRDEFDDVKYNTGNSGADIARLLDWLLKCGIDPI